MSHHPKGIFECLETNGNFSERKKIGEDSQKQTQLISLCEVLSSIVDNVTGGRGDGGDLFKLHLSKKAKNMLFLKVAF